MIIILCQMVNIEEWLKEKTSETGMSEAELARASGFDQSILSTAKNRNSIGPDIARRLAVGLKKRQDEVFYELGLLTEKPGEVVIKDDVLNDIWELVSSLTPEEKLAFRVMARRMFGAENGRSGQGNSQPTNKPKS